MQMSSYRLCQHSQSFTAVCFNSRLGSDIFCRSALRVNVTQQLLGIAGDEAMSPKNMEMVYLWDDIAQNRLLLLAV